MTASSATSLRAATVRISSHKHVSTTTTTYQLYTTTNNNEVVDLKYPEQPKIDYTNVNHLATILRKTA